MLFGDVVPQLIASSDSWAASDRLRVWCAGCSSGEEPYSFALHWALPPNEPNNTAHSALPPVEVVATDASAECIAIAERAVFDARPWASMGQLPNRLKQGMRVVSEFLVLLHSDS